MSEVQVTYETRAFRYACDVCDDGEMVNEGNIMLTSNPPKFPHRCNKCSFTLNLGNRYPRLETHAGPIPDGKFAGLTASQHEELMDRATPKLGPNSMALDPSTWNPVPARRKPGRPPKVQKKPIKVICSED